MNQTDKAPEVNKEVCSTTEVQYAEKNDYLSLCCIFSIIDVTLSIWFLELN